MKISEYDSVGMNIKKTLARQVTQKLRCQKSSFLFAEHHLNNLNPSVKFDE